MESVTWSWKPQVMRKVCLRVNGEKKKKQKEQMCAVDCLKRTRSKEGLWLMLVEGHFWAVQSFSPRVGLYSELRPASCMQLTSYSLKTRTRKTSTLRSLLHVKYSRIHACVMTEICTLCMLSVHITQGGCCYLRLFTVWMSALCCWSRSLSPGPELPSVVVVKK